MAYACVKIGYNYIEKFTFKGHFAVSMGGFVLFFSDPLFQNYQLADIASIVIRFIM